MEAIGFECFDLRAAFKHRLLHDRCHALADFSLHGHNSAHFNRGTSDFAVTLCEVNVTDEQTAAIDEARNQERGALDHLLDVHIAAVLTRWNGTQALVFVAAFRAANFGRTRTGRLRWQSYAACCGQLRFTCQPLVDFLLAWQNANRTHEATHRDTNTWQLCRNCLDTVQLPVSNVRLGVHIWQEAKARDDGGVTVFVRVDVDQFDRQNITTLRAFDMNRAGHRVNQVGVNRRDIFWLGVDVQFRIERITCMHYDQITRLRTCYWLDRWVITVEAVRVLLAMSTLLLHLDNSLGFDVSGVGHSDRTNACRQ